MQEEIIVNVNMGVLGHVDSGKTSVCAAISTILSTAALDKSPQSQARGITQDLQFSAFRVPKKRKSSSLVETTEKTSENTAAFSDSDGNNNDQNKNIILNFTVVDCPGHASLIRTIIGGASIIDMVLLVIDVTKGIQTQTAEGIIIAEITTPNIVILLNKIDLIPEHELQSKLDLIKSRISKLLSNSRFVQPLKSDFKTLSNSSETDSSSTQLQSRPLIFVPFSAKPSNGGSPIGLDQLLDVLSEVSIPKRGRQINSLASPSLSSTSIKPENFLMSVDHCFTIKGQGSVATGTILSGSLSVNQTIELVGHYSTHKVKSIQMFKKSVKIATEGDRVGVLLPSLEASLLERGLLSHPNTVPFSSHLIVSLQKIKYYKNSIESNSKFHVTVGHSTTLAKVVLFASGKLKNNQEMLDNWNINHEYLYSDQIDDSGFSYALLEMEKSIPIPNGSIYIASKLDTDINTPTCRLAFHGLILHTFLDKPANNQPATSSSAVATTNLSLLKVYKTKQKTGSIDRIVDNYVIVGKNLFKKETNMKLFIGLKVTVGEHQAVIDSSFGSSGKFKIRFSEPVAQSKPTSTPIILTMKKYLFNPSKTIAQ